MVKFINFFFPKNRMFKIYGHIQQEKISVPRTVCTLEQNV